MIPLLFFPNFIKKHPVAAALLGVIMLAAGLALVDMWRERRVQKQKETR